MFESCLRACVVADYQDAWDELLTASSNESSSSNQNPIHNNST